MKKKINKTIKVQDSEFFFDDCPICRAMKKAKEEGRDLNGKELKEAFREAKRQGAVVEGPIFDKENNVN